MKNNNESFDLFYTKQKSYFGEAPSDGLVAALEQYAVKPGKALDIGAGEGRNALYLAHLGFSVDAVEPSQDGAQKIEEKAKELGLNIDVKNTDYLADSRETEYDCIVAATSLDHMADDYLQKALSKLKKSLKVGGVVYIVVFTQEDPGFSGDLENASECAPFIQHYFKKNELKNAFADFEILFYDEYKKEDTTHGKPHFHAKAKLIARKK
jgi:cyclopropane fatty-acyl-phospholipid synthase-like methyltransferase